MVVPGWEDKLLFGTDHNYFSVLQAADLITFLFSKRFYTLLEDHNQTLDPLKVAAKILGGNAFNLIPVSWQVMTNETQSSEYLSSLKNFQQLLKEFISQEGNFIKLDLGLNQKDNSVLQVISFGGNNSLKSYIVHQTEDVQSVIIQETHSKLNKADLVEMDKYPLQSIKVPSSEVTTLNQDELKTLLTNKNLQE